MEMFVEPSRNIDHLLAIMAHLRDPERGCPWDVRQTFQSIAAYTVEEAYEVADAIERGDREDLKDELGDLLLQVVFHSRMAEEQSFFDFGDVVEAITRKLIRRHPHVFGDARSLEPADVKALWGAIKAEEKRERAARSGSTQVGHLDEVPASLPALLQAYKLQARASTVGFDWNNPRLVLRKIQEELGEVSSALDGDDPTAVRDEIGDLLFPARRGRPGNRPPLQQCQVPPTLRSYRAERAGQGRQPCRHVSR
jgi:nucleoside triphosphate diphosphatase